MVVVDCGLWAVTVAMVVDCGGDGRWWLSVFFFFFAAIWVDLMVVVSCGLWAVTVAVVVGYGGDGQWWLSMSLMIMGWDNILF